MLFKPRPLSAYLIASLLAGCKPDPAPPPPPAPDRDGRWLQDIEYLATELPRLHLDFFDLVDETPFRSEVAELKRRVPRLADHEIAVGIKRLAAMTGVGHTSVSVVGSLISFRVTPVKFYWFDDGIHVTAAGGAAAPYVGYRLLGIGRQELDSTLAALRRVVSHDNEMGFRWSLQWRLSEAEPLHAVGAAETPDSVTYRLAGEGGEVVEVSLIPGDVWPPMWYETSSARIAADTLPLYMRHTDRYYWYTYLPGSRTLYFQYNVCREMEGRSMRVFVRDLFAAADERAAERLVVDLRLNAGGDSRVLAPFLSRIARHPVLNEEGRLFVLIGRQTQSSALLNAMQLDRTTAAVVLGEPSGQRPNHYGEVRRFRLPNSRLRVSYATEFFRRVPGDPPALLPDVPIPFTSKDFFAGRDPLLAAAIRGGARSRSPDTTTRTALEGSVNSH